MAWLSLHSPLLGWLTRRGMVDLVSPKSPAELGADADLVDLVETRGPSLHEGFCPAWWAASGHAQTLYLAIANSASGPPMGYERHLLELADGGTFGLDFIPPLDVTVPECAPLVVVCYGTAGSTSESYVQQLAAAVSRSLADGGLGGRVAIVNFRGCATIPLTSPHLYSFGTTHDVEAAVCYLAHLFPKTPMYGVGFSVGGSIMARYLGEQGDKCLLRSACIISAPLRLSELHGHLSSRGLWSQFYSYSLARRILRSLQHNFHPGSALFGGRSPITKQLAKLHLMCRRYNVTVRLQDVLTILPAQVGGSTGEFPFTALQPFLDWACPEKWLRSIKRPTLAISAMDDPIVPARGLPEEAIKESSHVVLAKVPGGGHMGFFEGPWTGRGKRERWMIKPIVDVLRATAPSSAEPVEQILVEKEEGGWFRYGKVAWHPTVVGPEVE